ncbi:hypothetical protein NPIL_13411 [Nephila pilipes]|uniref:Uncharacterized protein n=1 Tax=Nephila pilipes TaxID=299642 RepID=A0A8X6N1E6_NEPPI|nr:hypothetical protein NPIL_13411 [Nephila pilipes]
MSTEDGERSGRPKEVCWSHVLLLWSSALCIDAIKIRRAENVRTVVYFLRWMGPLRPGVLLILVLRLTGYPDICQRQIAMILR